MIKNEKLVFIKLFGWCVFYWVPGRIVRSFLFCFRQCLASKCQMCYSVNSSFQSCVVMSACSDAFWWWFESFVVSMWMHFFTLNTKRCFFITQNTASNSSSSIVQLCSAALKNLLVNVMVRIVCQCFFVLYCYYKSVSISVRGYNISSIFLQGALNTVFFPYFTSFFIFIIFVFSPLPFHFLLQ